MRDGAGGGPSGTQGLPSCDRACLEQWLDRYVDAFVAHQPSRLVLSPDVKFTENGQRLTPGDGTWRTVTGKGAYALRLADIEQGQAVLMGTIREADIPTILILRLRIANQQIAEIETLVIRHRTAAENLDRIGRPRRALLGAVLPAERLSRPDLVRIANMYFSGIELNDGKGQYPLAKDCARLENGSVTAGDPALILGEAGLPVPAGGSRTERGEIGPVESVLHQVPYGMGSGWSTWEETMSSQPRW